MMKLLLLIGISVFLTACGGSSGGSGGKGGLVPTCSVEEKCSRGGTRPQGQQIGITQDRAEKYIFENDANLGNITKGMSFKKSESCLINSDIANAQTELVREFVILNYDAATRNVQYYVKILKDTTNDNCMIGVPEMSQDKEYILFESLPNNEDIGYVLGEFQQFFYLSNQTSEYLIMKKNEKGTDPDYGKFEAALDFGFDLKMAFPMSQYYEATYSIEAYKIRGKTSGYSEVLPNRNADNIDTTNLNVYYEDSEINRSRSFNKLVHKVHENSINRN